MTSERVVGGMYRLIVIFQGALTCVVIFTYLCDSLITCVLPQGCKLW